MAHKPGHLVDPDEFRNQLANMVVDDFLAQQDATNVENINTGFETGTPEDFLRQLFGVALDFTPGIGDIKAAGFDAPRQFREGQNIMGTISLLSALPFIGVLGDLIRAGTKRAGGAAADVLRSTTGARADALAPLRGPGSVPNPASEEAVGNILDRISRGRGGEVAAAGAVRQLDDLESIRRQIFRDLKRDDPFGDVAAQHTKNIEDIQALATRRSVR